MSVSGVGSSPVLQWLQSYLTKAGPATGPQSSCGSKPASDTTSISQEAVQLNASQGSQTPPLSQSLKVNGLQGHYGHHHHGGGQGGRSFTNQLAQSIITDLQNATGNGAPSGRASADATAQATTNGSSFIDKLASKISQDLLTKYQQANGSAGTTAQSSMGRQVNTTA